MTDYVWPNSVRISSCDWRPISNSRFTPDTFDSGQQTATRPGDKLGCTVRVNNSSGAERAKLRALTSLLRGRGNRCFLPDFAFPRRGSFTSIEQFQNADFSNGVSGWSVAGAGAIAASDGVGRLSASQGGGQPQLNQSLTLTQYAAYALRSLIADGQETAGLNIGRSLTLDTGDAASDASTSRGYGVVSGVVRNASALAQYPAYISSSSGYSSRAYLSVPFISMGRCPLTDSPANLFLQSNTFANAAWMKTNCTATDNAVNGPDASGNAASLIETAVNSTHSFGQAVTVSSSATEIFIGCVLVAVGRGWARLRLVENTGVTTAGVYFNLASGATGTVTTGANWSNVRSGTVALGLGYFYCWMVARKTNAATSVSGFVGSATADNTDSYLGVAATVATGVWHMVCAPSSLPMRVFGTPTTASALTTGVAQTSASIYLKGLPVSTLALLKQGDPVEINKILYPVAADLDSDAAGLGLLKLAFPPPRGITDNTPVIIGRPMGRMMLVNDPEIPCVPGGYSDFEFNFVQDLAA